MSFTSALKRSLGFEETEEESKNRKNNENSFSIGSIIDALKRPTENNSSNNQQQSRSQQQYTPRPTPSSTHAYYDDVISPEQSFYEIVLIRPKTIDDVNYIVDQVIEENNPVIIDLSFLEKESPANFKLTGDKIKQMRAHYGAQALLLSRSSEKNLIIVVPKRVAISNKG